MTADEEQKIRDYAGGCSGTVECRYLQKILRELDEVRIRLKEVAPVVREWPRYDE